MNVEYYIKISDIKELDPVKYIVDLDDGRDIYYRPVEGGSVQSMLREDFCNKFLRANDEQ